MVQGLVRRQRQPGSKKIKCGFHRKGTDSGLTSIAITAGVEGQGWSPVVWYLTLG